MIVNIKLRQAMRRKLKAIEADIVRLQTDRDILAIRLQSALGTMRPSYGRGSTNFVSDARVEALRKKGLI